MFNALNDFIEWKRLRIFVYSTVLKKKMKLRNYETFSSYKTVTTDLINYVFIQARD